MPRLLDLFCGAGGAAMGYQRAGFEVVGVDIKPQKHFPFEFHEADAMTYPLDGFDVIHASPPCQGYSVLAALHPGLKWQKLIIPLRDRLKKTGILYVIENVETSPLDGVILCGSFFKLGVERGRLQRHRRFESNVFLWGTPCNHYGKAVGVYGHGGHSGKHRMLYRQEAVEALGIDWMNRDEMSQAIPPAYTEFIGRQLIEQLKPGVAF